MARHVPPSRIRYEESHPTVTFRVPHAVKAKLDRLQLRTGKSLSRLLKEGLGLLEADVDVDQVYNRGWYNGYMEAVGLFDVPCAGCGEVIVLNGRKDSRVRGVLRKAFRTWRHLACL